MKRAEVPQYVMKLDFMLGSVAFIVVFSVLFMIIYAPFSLTDWFDIFDERRLSISVAFYLACIVIMVASKLSLVLVSRRIAIDRLLYFLWLVGETVAISLLYTAFTRYLVQAEEPHSMPEVAFRAFCCVTAILAIPYAISFLYAAYRAKLRENEVMRYRTRAYGEVSETPQLINLYDGNGTVRMTVDIDALYYMESQDNYVKVCYESEGALHNYMLRCRTKALEKSLEGTPMLRCHRSYIVNITKIKLLRPDKSNSVAILNHSGVKPIPVSKRYYESLVATIAVNPPEAVSAEISADGQ
ncbi:MAG: LytTR family transcriptional regulator [Alistipes sp.]|nr:LytTR family transcriptional regulator [Alistipes sp.]